MIIFCIVIFISFTINGSKDDWFWNLQSNTDTYLERESQLKDRANWPSKLQNCEIGGYKLIKFESSGADGRVFQAQKNNTIIAIKFMKEKNSLFYSNGFLGEFKAVKTFDSLNPRSKVLVQSISDMPNKCCGNIDCVALEWINGKTLVEIMTDRGALGGASPKILKPIDVNLVKQWIHHALIGHADMERVGIANQDQNLRNILWDEKSRQIKFVDFNRAMLKNEWYNNAFKVKGIDENKMQYYAPQEWEYLGFFLFSDDEKNEYWNFLKTIEKISTAKEALQFATQEDGYLYKYKDDVLLDPIIIPTPPNKRKRLGKYRKILRKKQKLLYN